LEVPLPEIALPAFHVTTTRKLTVEINHDLTQDLERYKAFYKQAYGAEVPEADLIREMARRFMESDREFQAIKNGFKSKSRGSQRSVQPQPHEGVTK
jgi:hypothetical protein